MRCLAFAPIYVSSIDEGVDKTWIESDRLIVVCDGKVKCTFVEEYIAPIKEGQALTFRVELGGLDQLGASGDCQVRLALIRALSEILLQSLAEGRHVEG